MLVYLSKISQQKLEVDLEHNFSASAFCIS